MIEVTGSTRVFAIVADPIAHVKTPQVINQRFRQRGFDGILVPLHVPAPDLPAVFAALRAMRNLSGFIATVPHKTAAATLCDELTPEAAEAGAANCVKRAPDGRLVGALLDGIGFVDGLRQEGIEPGGRSVYLAGAGGAAAAIGFALCDAGVSRLVVANRSAARRDELVASLRRHNPVCVIDTEGRASEADIVINGTSLGLRPGDGSPVDTSELRDRQIVAEVIMDPEWTPLLKAARERGCRVHLGRHMLEAQADAMIAHMTAGALR